MWYMYVFVVYYMCISICIYVCGVSVCVYGICKIVQTLATSFIEF